MSNIEFFGYLSNIVTVIAFLFAGYQFFLWRKQQRYALELEALLNMEDLFEIYIASLMRVYGYFDKANKLAREAGTREDKQKVDSYLKGNFRDMILAVNNETNENMKSYSLARFRSLRLGFDIGEIEELDPDWLRDSFESFLQNKSSIEEAAEEISKIKKVASEKFKRLRESI